MQVISPGGNCRAGEEHCQQQGHLLGLKGRGKSEGSQGTAELARLSSVCGKCREGREGGRRRTTWGKLGGGWIRGGTVLCFMSYISIYLYRYKYG